MRRFTTSSAMVVVLACCAHFAPPATAGPAESDPAATEMLRLGLRGVYFVPNQGQWLDAGVHYGLRSRGLDVAFRESMLTMHMTRETAEPSPDREGVVLDVRRETPLTDSRGSSRESADLEHLTLTVTFPGSNAVLPIGAQPQTAKFNYFVGGEGRETASNVPSVGAVIYEELYDGIDLLVCGNDDGVLKYEFHVQPGADYSQIRIAYDGIDSLCIDDAGNLQINTSFGTLADGAPVVWQEDSTSRACEETGSSDPSHDIQNPLPDGRGSSGSDTIPARFELCDARTYRIALDGPVDPTRELIIDPYLQWMTYLGGGGQDNGTGLTVDLEGNTFVTGHTGSPNFEGRTNSHHGNQEDYDAFVAKVDSTGQLQWMTYLGGSDRDLGYGIGVDIIGDISVAGYTYSNDFEGRIDLHHGGETDVFVVKVSPTGQLQWMTYLGGSGGDTGSGLAVDSIGNALVTGSSESTDFIGRINSYHGNVDGFLAKVNAAGIQLWMIYLGGGAGENGRGVAVDGADNAMVTGNTTSPNFEGRTNEIHGSIDAYVAKVGPAGQLAWMSYLGGSSSDIGRGIAVDDGGNVFVTGDTQSTDLEARTNAFHGGGYSGLDAFVAKIAPNGLNQWMTYLGGSGDDIGCDVAADRASNALVAGMTDSTDCEGRVNSHHGGTTDAFVVKVSPSGPIEWMSYLGGSGRDSGYGVAVNSASSAMVSGETSSIDFEGRSNSYHGSNLDAFVVKVAFGDRPQLSVNATCPSGGPIQVSWSGATRGGTIVLLHARNTGSFRIPSGNPCAGTQTGLGSNQIQIAYQGSAGPSGSRTVNSTTGPGACGGYLQLLDVATCATSNVVRIE